MPEPTATPMPHLCAPWCENHDDAGARDQWCLTRPRHVEPVARDSEPIGVGVDRYSGRPGRAWRDHQPQVTVRSESDWTDLRPHEARALARLLLAAADIAEGVSVAW